MGETRAPRTGKKPGPAPTSDWYDAFLDALRSVPVVKYAATTAGISRRTAYEARQRDEAFAVAWADAIQDGVDALESDAVLRARAGQPMLKTVTRTLADGTVETTVTEERHISDTLLMFLVKRHRPEFRESFRVEQTGPGGGPVQIEVTRKEEAVSDFYAELDRLSAVD